MSTQPPARDRLLAATALLTYTGGIEATGVDAIAKTAGVTKRTLYQHFGSKDALVGEALAMRDQPALDSLRAAVDRRVARGAKPVDALFRTLEKLFATDGFRGCAFLNAAHEIADTAHPVHPVARHHVDGRARLVADLCLAEGVDDPDVHEAVRLIAEGAFAVSGSERDAAVARRAGKAARRVLGG